MSFWNLFKRKEREKRSDYDFNDEDREFASKVCRQKAEIRRLRQEQQMLEEQMKITKLKAELEDLKDELYGEDEEDTEGSNPMESMLMSVLMSKFKGSSTPLNSTTNSLNPTAPLDLTHEEIKEALPNFVTQEQLAKIKKLPDSMKLNIIKSNLPQLSPATHQRVLEVVKEV